MSENNYDIASVWLVRPNRNAAISWLYTGVKIEEHQGNVRGRHTAYWVITGGGERSAWSRTEQAFVLMFSSPPEDVWDSIEFDTLDEALIYGKTLVPQWMAEEVERVSRSKSRHVREVTP